MIQTIKMQMIEIINIHKHPEWLDRAAEYFSAKWRIDKKLYVDRMNESLLAEKSVPRWYLMLRDDRIIGGFGLIENDFMVRTDLCPWLCALYIEPDERGQQLGARLLEHGRREAAKLGYSKVYLNTDHVGYYEKYDWRYMGDFAHQSGENARVYEADVGCEETAEFKIETSRLILRSFTKSDAAKASHNSKQPLVAHFMSDMVLESEDAALGWIRWINNDKFDIDIPFIVLAVEVKVTGNCIGLIGIAPKQEINNEIEIVFSIADEYQNKGYATEAGKAIIWWAFEKAGLNVMSAIVKPENKASRRVIEKLGFVYGDTRTLPYDGADCAFDYFRLYHTDYLPSPEWDTHNLYKAEVMGNFFKARAEGYNDHMLSGGGEENYKQLGDAFPKTDKPVSILDLGCGTGIELDYIWERIPNAHITCVDLSSDMLALLVKTHPNRLGQITAIEASYLDWNYPREDFDFAVSVQTMHHFEPEQKTGIYLNIHNALKPGGCYIESDFYVEAIAMEQYRRRFKAIMSQAPEQAATGTYHIDIPNTIDVQCQLLSDAGFKTVEVVESHIRPRWSGGIIKAGKEKHLTS